MGKETLPSPKNKQIVIDSEGYAWEVEPEENIEKENPFNIPLKNFTTHVRLR